MEASEVQNLLRSVFRIAFRLGEARAEKRHDAIKPDRALRFATQEEIDIEARYHIPTTIETLSMRPVRKLEVVTTVMTNGVQKVHAFDVVS